MTKDPFFKQGKRMTDEEINAYFKKKTTLRKGSFEWETARLEKELHDHLREWSEKAFRRFLDSDQGTAFIEKHKDKSSDEMLEIIERETNFRELLNREMMNKIDEFRGKVS